MSDLFWLTDAQMARLEPFFPKSHGKPRVDDRRVLSGIIFINRNGLRWRDAPEAYGPHKTLYNRWKRWSDKGVFARMMAGLSAVHVNRVLRQLREAGMITFRDGFVAFDDYDQLVKFAQFDPSYMDQNGPLLR